MRLTSLTIQNYKSLRDIEFEPREFSVLIGRNSSGKSNFADALEFLSIAYADGLENAVARKGGYENIAHRKERRSRSAIGFSVELKAKIRESELHGIPTKRSVNADAQFMWTFRHSFEFKATGEGIRSDFMITSEKLEIIKEAVEPQVGHPRSYEWLNLARGPGGKIEFLGDADSDLVKAALFDPKYWTGQGADFSLSSSELLFALPFFKPRIAGRFIAWITSLATFQMSPELSRHSGVPTPNPHMSARGENLPAVVDWLQRKKPKDWKSVLVAMKDIVPELSEISVNYLHTRTLGLFFHEKGVGRPWTAEEISDGTIRALAMLVACYDPRNTALLLEEPENSLHPWIIKEIMEHLRRLSVKKMVVVTSHSPVVLNMLSPREVWVIFKSDGETKIRPLVDFDPELMTDWEGGKYRLFDYLESGYVSEAVPSGHK